MMYNSTRDSRVSVSSSQAIVQGISRDGGLFVPETLPRITGADIAALTSMPYADRAASVLSRFLTDFTGEETAQCTRAAYGSGAFRSPAVAPVHTLEEGLHILELWHGPTCAFKDMALQILPHLMRVSASKTGGGEIVILVATSGDTGKAALEGFRDAPHTRILVFYPEDGVSPMQKLQMTTQEGGNVGVCAIRGNFDDAQSGVKAIFTDEAVGNALRDHGMQFSSANSINWGRLVPQIVYYISAYCDLVRDGAITMGDKVNFCVPTGNFGDILAAYYAKRMGLPVGKLICASNSNNVLTDFLRTGIYDRNRPFHTTVSPSMDILISSNLERLLFYFTGENDEEVRGYMEALGKTGRYEASDAVKTKLAEEFWGGFCGEEETEATVGAYEREYGYLIDTHTAVAAQVMEQYRRASSDKTLTVFVSTASPYKFCGPVLTAIGKTPVGSGLELLDQLHEATGVPVPQRLAALRGKPRRFDKTVEKQAMETAVLDFLK